MRLDWKSLLLLRPPLSPFFDRGRAVGFSSISIRAEIDTAVETNQRLMGGPADVGLIVGKQVDQLRSEGQPLVSNDASCAGADT